MREALQQSTDVTSPAEFLRSGPALLRNSLVIAFLRLRVFVTVERFHACGWPCRSLGHVRRSGEYMRLMSLVERGYRMYAFSCFGGVGADGATRRVCPADHIGRQLMTGVFMGCTP